MKNIFLNLLLLQNILLVTEIMGDGLEGSIKDQITKFPVVGAVIWLEGTDFVDTTDFDGNYSIPNIPIGKYTIIIDHNNYAQKVFTDYLIDKTVDVNKNSSASISAEFYLSQNYPNPFNPSTIISFQLPNAEHVTLQIYDSLGKHVLTLVDEWKSTGQYNIDWGGIDQNGSRVPSGIYFYQITAGKYSVSKKMNLVK